MGTEPSLRRDVLPLITASVYRLTGEYQTLGKLLADAGTLGVRRAISNITQALEELTEREPEEGRDGRGEDERELTPAEELLVAGGAAITDLRRIQIQVKLERSTPLKSREATQTVAALTTWYAQREVDVQLERVQLDLSEPVMVVTFALTRDDLTRLALEGEEPPELDLAGLGANEVTRIS